MKFGDSEPKHKLINQFLLVISSLVKGVTAVLVGVILGLLGLLVFQIGNEGLTFFSIAIGLPLIIIGAIIVFLGVYEVLTVFRRRHYSNDEF